MGNVIPFKRKTKIPTQLKLSEFDERMSRIKDSIDKIQALIVEINLIRGKK